MPPWQSWVIATETRGPQSQKYLLFAKNIYYLLKIFAQNIYYLLKIFINIYYLYFYIYYLQNSDLKYELFSLGVLVLVSLGLL